MIKGRLEKIDRALSHGYIYKHTFPAIQFFEMKCLKSLLRLKYGYSGLILKNFEINTRFTAVSNVPYRILNETTQSTCNSILGPRYLAVHE